MCTRREPYDFSREQGLIITQMAFLDTLSEVLYSGKNCGQFTAESWAATETHVPCDNCQTTNTYGLLLSWIIINNFSTVKLSISLHI